MIARRAQLGAPPMAEAGPVTGWLGRRWHLEAWRVTETVLLKNKQGFPSGDGKRGERRRESK